VTLGGTIQLYGQMRIKAAANLVNPAKLVFAGDVIQKDDGKLFVTNLGAKDFRHEIVFEKTATLPGGTFWMDGDGSTVRFKSAGNTFSTLALFSGTFRLDAEGACDPASALLVQGTTASRIHVTGRQTTGRLGLKSGTATGAAVISETGGTLVVQAAQSDTFPGGLLGDLGFTWAPKGAYTFTATGESSFTGALTVSNGTFVAQGETASLTNISSVTVAAGATLSVTDGATINPRLTFIDLASTATLNLPATAFTVDRLYLDGVLQAEDTVFTGGTAGAGETHLDVLPSTVTVRTLVLPGPGTRTVWTGAGGTTDAADLAVNWDYGGSVPRLWAKALVAVTGGSSMTLAADTQMNGLSFENGGSFQINGSGHALGLYWGGISIASAASGSRYVFKTPISIGGEQLWDFPVRGEFQGDISSVGPYDIYKTGAGEICLYGTNTFTGDLVISNGCVYVMADEALGASDTGKVVVRRSSTSVSPRIGFYNNAKISRPIELYGPDQNFYPVRTASSGVFELAGKVTLGDTNIKRFSATDNATLVFSGGVEAKGMFYVQGNRYVITNKSVNSTSSLYSDVKADVTLAVPSNALDSVRFTNESVLRIRTDNALKAGTGLFFGKGATLDLGGHELLAGYLFRDNSDTVGGVVTGGVGSVVTVKPAQGFETFLSFRGAASLCLNGSENMTLVGISTSTGTLQSCRASLIMKSDSAWTGGQVVVTNASSAVLLHPGARLGRHVDVHLGSGGKLTLYPPTSSSGAELGQFECRHLYCDGVKQPLGTYGAAASAAQYRTDTYFMANHLGVLNVRGDGRGTILLIR